MSEVLKEHIDEAMRATEMKETFQEWLTVTAETDVILEAKKRQEEEEKQFLERRPGLE